MLQLATVLVSNASATQRAGRAGRVGPGGRCYRLWPRADHGKLSEQDPPPIASADLVSLALAAAVWIDDMGHEQQPSRQEQMQLNSSPSEAATVAAVGAIRALPWVDPPPAGRLRDALDLLLALGAVAVPHPSSSSSSPPGAKSGLTVTKHGRQLASLPLHPRLAHMVVTAHDLDRSLRRVPLV